MPLTQAAALEELQ
jgi:hypothetical protein